MSYGYEQNNNYGGGYGDSGGGYPNRTPYPTDDDNRQPSYGSPQARPGGLPTGGSRGRAQPGQSPGPRMGNNQSSPYGGLQSSPSQDQVNPYNGLPAREPYGQSPSYSNNTPSAYTPSQQSYTPPPPFSGRDSPRRTPDDDKDYSGDFGNGRGESLEMASLQKNAAHFGQESDPMAVLNACRNADMSINYIVKQVNKLKSLQARVLGSSDTSSNSQANRDLDELSSDTMKKYREVRAEVQNIRNMPGARSKKNLAQVNKVLGSLKSAIENYQLAEKDFRGKMTEQMARQYQIVHTESTIDEARAAVSDINSNQQMFANEMMSANRRGQAASVLNAVEDRHKAIQKAEQDIIQLATMFQDLEAMVVQQEDLVANIETKGEETVEHMDNTVQQIEKAKESARSRNKYKWWCLGVSVLIVIVIVVVILIYKFVIQGNGSGGGKRKRFVLPLDSSPITQRWVVEGENPWKTGALRGRTIGINFIA